MLIAAVAVSVGVLPLVALLNKVLHGDDVGPVELTHAARIFARVRFLAAAPAPLARRGFGERLCLFLSVSRLAAGAKRF